MAHVGVVYKAAVLLMASLLVVQDFRQSKAQWAQTNGWGGAGVGKRMFTPPDLSGPCRVDPYVALLISRLAKKQRDCATATYRPPIRQMIPNETNMAVNMTTSGAFQVAQM
ncbi:uncharacterized protein [Haliotis asinina]|uniref:uncharacterized protein isoform X1 n=1 Tax=Haliotis asinina TaxID=109174 RepID=UPI003531BA4D